MTGADWPVIADSSMLATPSTASPSPGTSSPASTTTRSPRRNSPAPALSSAYGPSAGPVSRRATAWRRINLRVSAWARPGLSATASARFAKTTVSQSQTVISQPNPDGCAMASPVVRAAPISVTNMTGLRAGVTGSSLRSAAGRARPQLPGAEQSGTDPTAALRVGRPYRAGGLLTHGCGCGHQKRSGLIRATTR